MCIIMLKASSKALTCGCTRCSLLVESYKDREHWVDWARLVGAGQSWEALRPSLLFYCHCLCSIYWIPCDRTMKNMARSHTQESQRFIISQATIPLPAVKAVCSLRAVVGYSCPREISLRGYDKPCVWTIIAACIVAKGRKGPNAHPQRDG